MRNWFPNRFVLPAAALVCFFLARGASAVGFEQLEVPDLGRMPIEISVWYPSDDPTRVTRAELFEQDVAPKGALAGGRYPLVAMSHGTGGSGLGHIDTALALAHAGFIVVALTHSGDNYHDQSHSLEDWDRPRQVSRVLDFMLQSWPGHNQIDATRIGMFGFSAGGFTTLALVGGVADFRKIGPHCIEHPGEWACQRISAARDTNALPTSPPSLTEFALLYDPRIRAAVVAAPALGYTFAPSGLDRVRVPVQLWRAEQDHVLPDPDFAEAVRKALPNAPEYHVVNNADHFDFLAPCSSELARRVPEICADPAGFDRTGFHVEFDRDVVRFFAAQLATPT